MSSDDPCPVCGANIILVDPSELEWSLPADEYDDEAEVWLCVACGWHEEADAADALDEHSAALAWVLERIEQARDA